MLKKSLNIKFNLLNAGLKPALSSIFMSFVVYIIYSSINLLSGITGATYLINALATVTSIIFGLYSYLFCLILTSGVTKEDFKYLPSKFMRMIPKFMLERIR
jgi:stage V sporulation protein B